MLGDMLSDSSEQQFAESMLAMLHLLREEFRQNRFDPRSVEGMIPRITYGDGR